MSDTLDQVKAFFKAVANSDEAAVQSGIATGLLHQTGNGPSEGETGWSALHWAVHAAKPHIAPLLLTAGANVDAQEHCPKQRGRTPLFLAVEKQDKDVLKLLLDADANTEAVDEGGETPLHWAVATRNAEIVRMLLEKGANVDAPADDGYTALHLAALIGLTEISQVLLDAGANIQATSDIGQTPLHEAAVSRHSGQNAEEPKNIGEIMKVLLERGADPHVRNDNGRTAQDIALEEPNEVLAALLKGVEEDLQRSRVLTVTAAPRDPSALGLTFTTVGGNVAAELAWPWDAPTSQLLPDLIAEIRGSGFTGLREPLTGQNLRLLKQDGTPLTWDGEAPSLGEQLGIPEPAQP